MSIEEETLLKNLNKALKKLDEVMRLTKMDLVMSQRLDKNEEGFNAYHKKLYNAANTPRPSDISIEKPMNEKSFLELLNASDNSIKY